MKSALLDVFGNKAETQIEGLQRITNGMARTGTFSQFLSWVYRRRLRIMVGRLLQLRGLVNLHSDLLDRPYFRRSAHEHVYMQLWAHFSLDSRIELLNTRLDYANEVTKVIVNTSAHNQMLVLDSLMILLICVEVGALLRKGYAA